MKRFWTYSVIVFVSVLVGYSSFELYERYVIFRDINAFIANNPLWIENQTLNISSPDVFFHREPKVLPNGLFKVNATIDFAAVVAGKVVLDFSVRTNNMGMLSDKQYQVARDPLHPEYRIVLLGDSFTGSTTATYEWPDTLEDVLNSSETLRQKVGGKKFRVYNLGWVAAGFPTFWEAYQKAGRQFDPDMIAVNYNRYDYPRATGPLLTDENAMVDQAISYIEQFRKENRDLLVTQMPTYNEYFPTRDDNHITTRIMAKDPSIKIAVVGDRMPFDMGEQEVFTWYNLPFDLHMSDKGGELYARALAGVIAQKITGERFEFGKVRTQPYEPAGDAPTEAYDPGNQITHPNFEDMAPGHEFVARNAPVNFATGWVGLGSALPDRGAARLTLFENRAKAGDAKAAPARYLRFQEFEVPGGGAPSIWKIVGPAQTLAGERARVSLQMRSDESRQYLINLYQQYPTKDGKSRDVNFFVKSAVVPATWSKFEFYADIPPLPEDAAVNAPLTGASDLRLQIVPYDSTKTFTLDIASLNLRQEASIRHLHTSVHRLVDHPDRIAKMLGQMREQMIHGKVFNTWYPYGFVNVFLHPNDGVTPDPTRPLNGGFVALPFGDTPDDVAYLNVVCTWGDIKLDSPYCFHRLHMFIK